MDTVVLEKPRSFSRTTNIPTVGDISIAYTLSGDEFPLLNILEDIRQEYISIARDAIKEFFGPDPKQHQTDVDGRVGAPIESARLNGEGILAFQIGGIEGLKEAFNAAWSFLGVAAPVRTGYYKSSARTSASGMFTIRVNGREVSNIDWDRVTAKSNIQIYSKARYASPLESIYRGGIFIGARHKAVAAGKGLVRASMSYRKASEMGQVEITGRKGQKFKPLSVPVLEIGTVQSNVTNFVGQVEWNLQRGRKRPDPNLVDRKILPESRRRERWNRPRR